MSHDFLYRGFGNISRFALFDKTADQRLYDLVIRYIHAQFISRLIKTVLKRNER